MYFPLSISAGQGTRIGVCYDPFPIIACKYHWTMLIQSGKTPAVSYIKTFAANVVQKLTKSKWLQNLGRNNALISFTDFNFQRDKNEQLIVKLHSSSYTVQYIVCIIQWQFLPRPFLVDWKQGLTFYFSAYICPAALKICLWKNMDMEIKRESI